MKSRVLFLVSILIASGALAAHAGSTATQSIGGSAGLVAPMGDFADAAGAGWFLGGSYNYRFNPQWAAGVDLDYFSFGEKSVSTPVIGGTRTVKTSAHGGQSQFYAKYFIPMKDARFEPYLKAGYFHYSIGFKSTVTFRGSAESTDKERDSGFGIGVGASRKLNEKARAGLELLYCQIQTSGESADFWQLGFNYSFRLGR